MFADSMGWGTDSVYNVWLHGNSGILDYYTKICNNVTRFISVNIRESSVSQFFVLTCNIEIMFAFLQEDI